MERWLRDRFGLTQKLEQRISAQVDPRTPTRPVTDLPEVTQSALFDLWHKVESYTFEHNFKTHPTFYKDNAWCEPKNFSGTSFVGICLALPESPRNIFVQADLALGGPLFQEAMYIRYKTKGNISRRMRFSKDNLGPPVGQFWSCVVREDKEVLGIRKKITYSGAAVQSIFTPEAEKLLGKEVLRQVEGVECPWSLVERLGLYTILFLAPGRIAELPQPRKSTWCREEAVFAVRCTKPDLDRWGIKPPGSTVTQPSL